MLKKILAILAMLYAAAAFAAVDVNTAKASELDGLKGIGPVMSKRILDERKKGKFKDWPDLVARVKGLGDTSAAKLSTEGLTVNGEAFKAAATAKEAKAEAKAEKKEAKAEAKADKKEAKAEAKADKKEAKAAAAKPAASAASAAKK
jgi:competence protein ComEA